MSEINPVDVAIEMLKAELPGFDSRFVAARDAVGIRGGLPIAAELSAETIMYPVYSMDWRFDDAKMGRSITEAIDAGIATPAEIALVEAKERAKIKRELAPIVETIVRRIRNLAIEAVGLEAEIRQREARAIDAGRREGDLIGYGRGVREGRAAAMRDIVGALLTHSAEVGEAVDEIRESWTDDLDE